MANGMTTGVYLQTDSLRLFETEKSETEKAEFERNTYVIHEFDQQHAGRT